LHFGEATLTFPQTLVLRYGRFEPEARRNPQVVNDYVRWFLARTRGVAEALAGRQYLCAGRFTAADISVGYALMLASHIDPIKDRIADELRRYWQGLAERDGFQRALAAQETAAKAQGVDPTPAPLAGG
jgi:glutathione S-transferase